MPVWSSSADAISSSCFLKRVETLRAFQQRKLQREHQKIEALGLLGSEVLGRRQRRDLVNQFLARLLVDQRPASGFAILFDGAAMLADDEIVEVEAGDGVLQRLQRVGANLVLARRRFAAASVT